MVNNRKRGAEHIAQALAENDIQTVFSLSGNQIMPVYDALLDSNIHIVHTRHEGAAVYMAEAAAQVSGKISVALLTAGPGFANGLSAIYTAKESETPIIILSGDSPIARDYRGAFQELDQCAAASALAKASFRSCNAAGMHEDINRAIAIATSGRPGPVHLALPDDVLRELVQSDPKASSVDQPALDSPPTEHDIELFQSHINNATAPIILAGPTYCRPRWKQSLAQLSEKLNVPVVTFESPRGLKAPRLGAFAEVIGKTDALITIGKPLNFMVGFGELPVLSTNCKILQIDADPELLRKDAEAHKARALTQINCNSDAVLKQLIARENLQPHKANGWRSEVNAAVSYRPPGWSEATTDPTTIKSLDVARQIGNFTSKHPAATLIIDGGEIGQWCQATADAEVAVINGPSGAIGASTPYAIGTKAIRPDQPVLTVMGDGTAGFYLAEFETAVRENIPFVAVIGNDAKWNAEHQIQLRDYGADRTFACELTEARYDRVVAELGGHGELVTSAAEITPAIERAIASGKPACVNILMDGQAAPVISMN